MHTHVHTYMHTPTHAEQPYNRFDRSLGFIKELREFSIAKRSTKRYTCVCVYVLNHIFHQLSCCSVAQSCLTLPPHGLQQAHQASLSFTISRSLLKLLSIESVMPSNHLILCPPLYFLPSVFPSIRVFSNESVLRIRWPKYWSFSFSISPSNEYSGLISFRMDWLDLLAVQGTLKSLLQHHSSKT